MSGSEYSDPNLIEPWIKNTLLYRQWEQMKREIQLHKWYESQKAGYDIGWERAVIDWLIRYGCQNNEPDNT